MCRINRAPESPLCARNPIRPSPRDATPLYAGSGVGSGVGWVFVSLRHHARDCAMETLGRPMNTGDFRYAQ